MGACPTVEDFALFYRATLAGPGVSWHEASPGDAGTTAASDGGVQCCYEGEFKALHCPGGRPFLVNGEPLLAALEELETRYDAETLLPDGPLAQVLVERWLLAARMERASTASFARLALELSALGAPPGLVEAAQRAGLDELRHAELCLTQAHRYTRKRFRFGAFPSAGRWNGSVDFTDFVNRNLLEGCIGETIASAAMVEQARGARDTALAKALQRVAEDEAAHAALAWRILRWALSDSRNGVREAVRNALALAHASFREGRPIPSDAEHDLSVHGQLDGHTLRGVAACVWDDAILPLARELLSESFPSLHGQRFDDGLAIESPPRVRPSGVA